MSATEQPGNCQGKLHVIYLAKLRQSDGEMVVTCLRCGASASSVTALSQIVSKREPC